MVRDDYGSAPQLLTSAADVTPYTAARFGATEQPGDTATLEAWLGAARKDASGKDLPGAPGKEGNPASPVQGNASGRTRALVHMGSASHSSNLGRRWGAREAEFPPKLEDDVAPPFRALNPPIWVRQPVVATQGMMVRFFTSAFEGAAVIDTSEIPLRIDFDDDGYCDATERAAGTSPSDPASHPTTSPDCAWETNF